MMNCVNAMDFDDDLIFRIRTGRGVKIIQTRPVGMEGIKIKRKLMIYTAESPKKD